MNTRGLSLALGVLCVGLGGTLTWLLTQRGAGSYASGPTPDEIAARRQAIERMVAATMGTLDSHPDPQVAKVMLPSITDGHAGPTEIRSNRFGMRETDWAVPKPANTVRIVLLGDSFIYGLGAPAEQRLGVCLQKALAEHTGASPAPVVEVLHIGIVSWNILAECAFLRRQLSLLQPDLVIHHIVPNDLDDTHGVRGFGVDGRNAPLHREQADAYVAMTFGREALHPEARTLLPWAHDAESRARLDAAVDALLGLRGALAAQDCAYLVEVNWHSFLQVAARALSGRLSQNELLFLPSSHYFDAAWRMSRTDEHWSPAGHEEQARLLFGAIRMRKLLPALALTPWPEAEQRATEVWRQGYAEAFAKDVLEERLARQNVTSSIEVGEWDPNTAGEVYTGITPDGNVSPYAICVLAGGGARIHVAGQALARPEMDGATLSVFVECLEAGTHVLRAGQPFDVTFPVPEGAAGHEWLAIRLQTSDFVYDGPELRRCVSFGLRRIAIEP